MSLFEGQQKVCLALSSPHRMFTRPDGSRVYDTVSPLWYRQRAALSHPSNLNLFEIICDGMEVGEARSFVAARCLEHDPPPTFLWFHDDDVLVPSDALVKLFFRARTHPQHDIYSGVYCLKRPGLPEPLIYGENGHGPLWDWTVGDLLTTQSHGVKSVHMGLTLIRVSLFQKLIDAGLVHGDGTDQDDEPFFKTINESRQMKEGKLLLQMGTEDIYFCNKVMKLGGSIFVDTSVLAGHHDKATGITYGLPADYGPAKRAKWMARDGKSEDRQAAEDSGLKLAVDLGAGSDRREWPGHVTCTVDASKDSGADYIQDLRKLNLPDDHFDLVASSHALEHIPRWEQETVWREIFRICKPGGSLEIFVPNLEWAAWKIIEGEADEHAYNVLYGSQEAWPGLERQYNTHFFGYTPAVIKALAEQAGFKDVTTESWKQRDELGYNLICRGRKPVTVEEFCPLENAPLHDDERMLAEMAAG